MIRALFPGSFDPFTIGHLDIAERAAAQVGELVVGVGANPAKNPMFTVEQRVAMASAALAHLGNVRVAALQGATMDAARGLGAALIVKGVRGPDDAARPVPRLVERRARAVPPGKGRPPVCSSRDQPFHDRQ